MMLLSSGPAGHLLFLTVFVLVDIVGGFLECSNPPDVQQDETEYEPLEKDEDKSKLPHLKGSPHRSLINAMEYKNIKTGGNIEVDCEKDVIYNVTVKAWVEGNRQCGGLTPELLKSSKNCIWKSSCNVTYQPSIIMFPFSECFGVEPSYLELSYKCLKSDTTIRDVKNTHQLIESESGTLVASKSLDGDTKNRRYRAFIRPPPSMGDVAGVEIQVIQADIKDGSRVYITDSIGNDCDIPDNKCPVGRLGKSPFVFNVYNTDFIPSYHVRFQWYRNGTKSENGLPKEGNECKNENKDEEVKEFPIIKETTSKSSKGILRSHARFPWNYRRPLGTRHQNQWTSFYHRLESPTTGQDLLIKVVNLDLDPRDTLQFKVGNDICNISETDLGKLKTYDKCKKLEVNFTIQHGGFPTRSGFLIHYEWIPKSKPEMFKGPVIYDQPSKGSDVDITLTTSREPCRKKGKKCVGKDGNRTALRNETKVKNKKQGKKNKSKKETVGNKKKSS